MSLKNWRDNGWLADHKTSAREIADLLTVSERDLKDSSASGISPDWQLAIAYNACSPAVIEPVVKHIIFESSSRLRIQFRPNLV